MHVMVFSLPFVTVKEMNGQRIVISAGAVGFMREACPDLWSLQGSPCMVVLPAGKEQAESPAS